MKKTFARLLGYMGKSRGALLLSALCAAGNVLCVLLAPVLIGRAVDAMAAAGRVDFAALGRLVLWLAGLYLAGNLLLWSLSRTTNRLSYDTVGRLRAALYAKLDTLPLAFFDGTPRGDTVSRFVVDADAIADGLLQGTAALLTGGFTLVGSLVFMVSPLVDQIADERTDIRVGKVNVDEETELAAKFGVMSIPTLVVMKNGAVANRAVGARPKEDILALLD